MIRVQIEPEEGEAHLDVRVGDVWLGTLMGLITAMAYGDAAPPSLAALELRPLREPRRLKAMAKLRKFYGLGLKDAKELMDRVDNQGAGKLPSLPLRVAQRARVELYELGYMLDWPLHPHRARTAPPGTTADDHRTNVRRILLRFAGDLVAAEDRQGVVGVMTALDRYVEEAINAAGSEERP